VERVPEAERVREAAETEEGRMPEAVRQEHPPARNVEQEDGAEEPSQPATLASIERLACRVDERCHARYHTWKSRLSLDKRHRRFISEVRGGCDFFARRLRWTRAGTVLSHEGFRPGTARSASRSGRARLRRLPGVQPAQRGLR